MFSNALHGENSRNGSLCTIAPCLDLALRSAVLGIVHDRDKLDWADFVLLICTETYYRRFRGHEQSDMGKGVDWESQLITLDRQSLLSRPAADGL
jgi:hypothetical protein